MARSLEAPRLAENPLPYARGNSAERMEATPEERAQGAGPAPEPSVEPPAPDVVERPPEPLPRSVPRPRCRDHSRGRHRAARSARR